MSKMSVEMIVPMLDVRRHITNAQLHFLDIYDIGLKGAMCETCRLVLNTMSQKLMMMSDQLVNMVDMSQIQGMWNLRHEHVFPKFNEQEALDIFRRIVLTMYDVLYDLLRYGLATVFIPNQRFAVSATNYSALVESVLIAIEVDYIPF